MTGEFFKTSISGEQDVLKKKKKSNCKGNCIICYFPCYVSPSACVCKSNGFFIKHTLSFQWWGSHVSYLQPFNAGYHPHGGSDGDWRVQVCGPTPESSRRTAALWRRRPLCLSLLLITGTLVCSLPGVRGDCPTTAHLQRACNPDLEVQRLASVYSYLKQKSRLKEDRAHQSFFFHKFWKWVITASLPKKRCIIVVCWAVKKKKKSEKK